jgi:hypothetical protein
MSEEKRHDSRKITVPLRTDEIQRILKESEFPPPAAEPLRPPSPPPDESE